MYTLLDYIYIENVYKPQRQNLRDAYMWEITSLMVPSKINEVLSKKIGLTKALNEVNQIEI